MSRTLVGKEFHTRGPATEKALSLRRWKLSDDKQVQMLHHAVMHKITEGCTLTATEITGLERYWYWVIGYWAIFTGIG